MAHQWRGVIARVRRPPARPTSRRASSRSARAARRSSRRRRSPQRTGAEVWVKFEGMNPTGSFKDRGMTTAMSAAAEQRREGRHLRVDRQHVGVGRRLRRRTPAWRAVLVPDGKIAMGKLSQAIAHGASCCRSTATSTTA